MVQAFGQEVGINSIAAMLPTKKSGLEPLGAKKKSRQIIVCKSISYKRPSFHHSLSNCRKTCEFN